MIDISSLQIEQPPRWNVGIEEEMSIFPIVMRLNERSRGTTYHRQPGIEIHITQEGRGLLKLNEKVLYQSPKQVVIFRANTPHQLFIDPKTAYRRTVICIDDIELEKKKIAHLVDLSWIKEDQIYNFPIKAASYPLIDRLCHQTSEEIKDQKSGWQRMSFAYVLEITVLLQRMIEEQPGTTADLNVSGMIQSCMDFVQSGFNQDVSLTTVADMFSVSPEHLTRTFRKELGISYHQYIIHKRVEESKRLLRFSPELSILDVAMQVGFDSASHFCRTFRQLIEETPSSYRKRMVN
jgi:AraC-like DNA-binding protein